MQSTSISPPWHTRCYYPVPNNHFSHNLHLHTPSKKITINSRPRKSQYTNHNVIAPTSTHSCSKEQENKQKHNHQENSEFLQEFCSSVQNQEPHFGEGEAEQGFGADTPSGISSSMGWTDLKAALGQRINFEGIACSFGIFSKDKQLAIPHVSVPDIRYIDWAELKNRGFQGVVFDKDNTITVPYSLSLWAPLGPTIEQCKSLFGSNIAVFSNSAGLYEYDPDGRKAGALEDAIGIKVIRHQVKKPAGTAEEIEKNFGCESSRLIMVGDRPFTDIVYGNRNGFFTILSEPLSHEEEPLIVRQAPPSVTKRVWEVRTLYPIASPRIEMPYGLIFFARSRSKFGVLGMPTLNCCCHGLPQRALKDIKIRLVKLLCRLHKNGIKDQDTACYSVGGGCSNQNMIITSLFHSCTLPK